MRICDINTYIHINIYTYIYILAKEWGCPFLETSAKEKINNSACFEQVVREIRKYDDTLGRRKKKRGFCMIL